jgi:excisionase family DNA binding protein
MSGDWLTVKEVAEILSVSERHIRNMASSGKLKARKDKNGWLIHSSLVQDKEGRRESTGKPEDSAVKALVELLQEQVKEKDKQIEKLQQQLSDTSERQETIIMQLTRQLESSQKMIESGQKSWIRKLFKK